MLIKDWLPEFLDYYWPSRFGREWPGNDNSEGRQIWSQWLKDFIEVGAKQNEADLAAARIKDKGIVLASPGAHLLALVAEIGVIRTEVTTQPIASDRDQAASQSWGCKRCAGTGLAPVFHPRYTGDSTVAIPGNDGVTRMIPGRVAAHCTCPMGRWIRSKTESKMLPRIPDLQAVLDGDSRWLAFDPSERHSGDVLDMHDFQKKDGGFDWKAMFAALGKRTEIPHDPK